jgi:glutamate decarboxylase
MATLIEHPYVSELAGGSRQPQPAIIIPPLIAPVDRNVAVSIEQSAAQAPKAELNRAEEAGDLIDAVKELLVRFIRAADESAVDRAAGRLPLDKITLEPRNVLVTSTAPAALARRLDLVLPPDEGRGKNGLIALIQDVLDCSVNTWDQGFLDKLTSSTNAVGIVSEMVLATLNSNSHVYHVSPALTIVEKVTARSFAQRFGFSEPHSGGITCQGGSASNFTALVIARGALYPQTKLTGNSSFEFVAFSSEHGHYSIQKAAMAAGMGMGSVIPVPSDFDGRMNAKALRELVVAAITAGKTPFFVNATAGTTVLGAYDPFHAINDVCREFNLWFHVDGSWGGNAIWSSTHKWRLDGSHLADSLTVNPHKMLSVPMTCSFLLAKDIRRFHRANTLPAGYLFHELDENESEVWDMADLTLQCGRRADSLKLALSWMYYGSAGFERAIDHAFAMTSMFAELVSSHPNFKMVSSNPPPCLQVCFYYIKGAEPSDDPAENTSNTVWIVKRVLDRGFMIDYAPGPCGSMFRVVLNPQTLAGTVSGLMTALVETGSALSTATSAH